MPSSPNFSPLSRSARIGVLAITVLALADAPVRASGLPNPLFAAASLVRGVVSIPFQIVGGIAKGIFKAVGKKPTKDDPKK